MPTRRIFALLGLLLSPALHAQQPAEPARLSFPILGTDISVLYPAAMHREDPAGISTRVYRGQFGDPAKTFACHPILLELGLGAGAPVTRGAPEHPDGGIVLQELRPACHPLRSDDDFARLIAATLSAPGFTPMGKMIGNHIAGYQTFVAIVRSTESPKPGVPTRFVGTIGIHYKDHFYVWTAISNDPGVFSDLLRIRLRFSPDPKLWPLTPFALGARPNNP